MIVELTMGLRSLKAAFDLTKGLNAANTQVQINEAKIGLQNLIFEAQNSLSAALEKQTAAAEQIRELEQEIVGLKDWSAEKQRYELAETERGTLAYRLKEGMEQGEPAHWICPNCYQEGRKLFLQVELLAVGRTETLNCNRCDLNILTRGMRHQEQPRRPGGTGRGR